jgi:indole-3-glycerol phosphate synthase/phosphoribosylanthranilate isomerase
MSETILDRIVAATRADLAERQARVPLDELRERAASAPAPRDFAAAVSIPRPDDNIDDYNAAVEAVWEAALRPAPGHPARLIAEIKRASPSKGLIAERFDPVEQAKAYEAGGAAAISVLTEPRFFQGSLEHLAAVRAAVSLPVLRKDFTLDPYQVYEARAAGADAILLICALLDDALLGTLLGLARSLGMEALVEAHDADEVRRAVDIGAKVIGVNSRDLRTFAVDTDIVRHLRPLVPPYCRCVAESGIADVTEAARARAWGADAILVGEALMRAADPMAMARALATAPGGGTIAEFFTFKRRPFVKICGIVTPEQAMLADEHWASAIGLVFAPMAPAHRRVTVEQAKRIMEATLYGEGLQGYVGVFVNESAPTIAAIIDTLHLSAVQLSGDESPEACAELIHLTGHPVLKAVRPRSASGLDALDAYALAGAVIVLDTPKDGSYGGTGETGDWALAAEAAKRWPIILSGGLTPENVADVIKTVQPRGVDVSSGVETNRAKDPDKIARFIAAAREAQPSFDHTQT